MSQLPVLQYKNIQFKGIKFNIKMFPFGMSLSDRMDFLKTGTTLYTSVCNNNSYGNNNPTSSGLSYSQGYTGLSPCFQL